MRCQECLEIVIFLAEIAQDVSVFHGGVVGVLQPGIGVFNDHPVVFMGEPSTLRLGGVGNLSSWVLSVLCHPRASCPGATANLQCPQRGGGQELRYAGGTDTAKMIGEGDPNVSSIL